MIKAQDQTPGLLLLAKICKSAKFKSKTENKPLIYNKEKFVVRHTEIERRFVLLNPNLGYIKRNSIGSRICQGYFPTPAHNTVRIRQVDWFNYSVASKKGIGRSRLETEFTLTDFFQGKTLLDAYQYHLKKRRYRVGIFEVDIYKGSLAGLIILEREMHAVDEEFELPEWAGPESAIEITEKISGYDLAKLASLLSGIKDHPPVAELVTEQLPITVITGGPGSGKTGILDILQKEMADIYHFIPEAATIIIRQVGVAFPNGNPFYVRQFQQQVYAIQQSFELLAGIHGKLKHRSALITDRGSMDNSAYLPGGIREYQRVCHTKASFELARYARVIHLGMPPRDVYEEHKQKNPARTEIYEQACELHAKIATAWLGHPNYVLVDEQAWDSKIQVVRNILTQ
jgi:CYTH domain-containing protein/predicted ATPase